MKKAHLPLVTSLMVSFSLAFGILVSDLSGYRVLTSAHAQTNSCSGTTVATRHVRVGYGLVLVVVASLVLGVVESFGTIYLGNVMDRDAIAFLFLVAVLMVTVLLFPWACRNHRLLGRWIWTTTNGGITAYDGFRPGATGAGSAPTRACRNHAAAQCRGRAWRGRSSRR